MTNDILVIKPNSPMETAAHLVQLETLKKQLIAKIDEYRASLLQTTKELDVLSLKTGSYIISRIKKQLPRVEDFETLKKSLDEADIPYDTKEVFADHMTTVFGQAIKEGKKLEGLGVLESEFIMVRISQPEKVEDGLKEEYYADKFQAEGK